jgi:hypothetical protein
MVLNGISTIFVASHRYKINAQAFPSEGFGAIGGDACAFFVFYICERIEIRAGGPSFCYLL